MPEPTDLVTLERLVGIVLFSFLEHPDLGKLIDDACLNTLGRTSPQLRAEVRESLRRQVGI